VFFNFRLSRKYLYPSLYSRLRFISENETHISKQELRHLKAQHMLRDADAHRTELEAITPSESPEKRQLHPNEKQAERVRVTSPKPREITDINSKRAYYSALQQGDLDEAQRILLVQKSIIQAEAAVLQKANTKDAGQTPDLARRNLTSKSLQDGGKIVCETVDSFTAIFRSPAQLAPEDDATAIMRNVNVLQGDEILAKADLVFLQFSEGINGASGGASTAPFVASPSNTNTREKVADDSFAREAGSVHKVGQGDPRSEAATKTPQSTKEILEIQPVAESSEPSVSRFSHNDVFCDNLNLVPVSRVRRSQRDHTPTSDNKTRETTTTFIVM
jgi:hypothetical protein